MTRTMLAALLLAGLTSGFGMGNANAQAAHRPHRAVPRASVTGSYERRFHGRSDGDLQVQELPGNRIKFEILALEGLDRPGGPRDSEFAGTILRHGGTAVYRSDEDGVTLTFRFQGRKVRIGETQTSGGGAFAGGTYVRTRRKPEFNPAIEEEVGPHSAR